MASAYVHMIQEMSPGLTAMASVQYAYNRYRLYEEKYIGTDFAVPYHFVNPRIGANLNLDASWNVYASVGIYDPRAETEEPL